MRIAVIDCGTNTFHLVIADTSNGRIETLFKKTVATKLGEDAFTQKIINPEGFLRGIQTLKYFSDEIKAFDAKKIYAFATATVRMAKNGLEFIQSAYDETGIKIELISGDKEAELIYYGVKQAVNLTEESSLIMDIGGGSTEFIICNKHKIFWRQSFDIGASLLLETITYPDPIQIAEMENLNQYFNETLKSLHLQTLNFLPKTLIGSSGSFDTFAQLIGWRFHDKNILQDKTEYDFNMDEYKQIHMSLINSTGEERRRMKGMVSLRIDMIVVASVLLTFVLRKTGIKKMKWSDYALKEGILFHVSNSLKP